MKKQALKFIIRTNALSTWVKSSRESLEIAQATAAADTKIALELLYSIERRAPKLINVEVWKKLYAYYTSKGATALPAEQDPIATMPSLVAMRNEINEMKSETKGSLKVIASSLNVNYSSLYQFLKGDPLGVQAAYALRDALVRLKTKPAELAKEGELEEKEVVVKASKKNKKKSLIEAAAPIGSGISAYQLDMMELQVIHRLRGHMLTEPQKPLNGRQRH